MSGRNVAHLRQHRLGLGVEVRVGKERLHPSIIAVALHKTSSPHSALRPASILPYRASRSSPLGII